MADDVDRFGINRAAKAREKAAQTDTRFGGNIERSNTGGGTPYDSSKDWISKPQDRETYYSPGGQGTTNENITNRAFENFNEEAQKEALAEKIAAKKNEKTGTISKVSDFLSDNAYVQMLKSITGQGRKNLIKHLTENPGQALPPELIQVFQSLLATEIGSKKGENTADVFGSNEVLTQFSDWVNDKGELTTEGKEKAMALGMKDPNEIEKEFLKSINYEGTDGQGFLEGIKNAITGKEINFYPEDGVPGSSEMIRTKQGLGAYSNADLNFLKSTNPALYYAGMGSPTTTGGLETMAANLTFDDIANSGLSGAQRRRLGYELQQAREAGRDRDGSGGQSGIMTTVPPVVPDPDDPMIPVDPDPYFPVDPTLPVPPKYPSSVITDYTQLGLPNIYGNQQIPTYDYANFNQTGQPVGLQDYLENLRQRFGIG